jgi:hypothetical protein
MPTYSVRLVGLALVFCASSIVAQTPKKVVTPIAKSARDTTESEGDDGDDAGSRFQFGIAGGALQYSGGRTEQALGAVFRWVPVPWLSLSATPTSARASEPALSVTSAAATRSGLTDLPLEATLSRGFGGTFSPSVAASFGVTLPVGDTASGLGSGELGTSISGGVGFSPAEKVWVHLGAGRSLSRFAVQSAFSSGTGWGDASAGYALTNRFSVSGGYSSDLGAVDSTFGRSTSIEGGMSVVLRGNTTFNANASHGVGGSAPRWSLAFGLGTAFPYLNHLGAHSAAESLQQTFGGGTHGLSNQGNGNAAGKTNSGRGRGNSGP